MEIYITDIQLETPPIDEVLTSEAQITLDLDNLMQSDILCEISLHDIELDTELEDVQELESDENTDQDYEHDFLDQINLDLDTDIEDLF